MGGGFQPVSSPAAACGCPESRGEHTSSSCRKEQQDIMLQVMLEVSFTHFTHLGNRPSL